MPVDRPPRAPSPHLTPQIAQAIFNWIAEQADLGLDQLVDCYLQQEAYANHGDALIELEDRYGLTSGRLTADYQKRLTALGREHARGARQTRGIPVDALRAEDLAPFVPNADRAVAFLHCLPEPELLTGLECYAFGFRCAGHPLLAGYLEHVFRVRSLPYSASANEGIRWVGEPAVREHAIEPALVALADPRLSMAREEFDKARRHLRRGEFKDAGKWAGDAVETTMAILLGAHGHPQPQTKHGTDLVQANKLWDVLKSSTVGLLSEDRDKEVIYAPMKVRNACGHGAGANPTPPDQAYVEAGVAAAAVAIAYLASKLR